MSEITIEDFSKHAKKSIDDFVKKWKELQRESIRDYPPTLSLDDWEDQWFAFLEHFHEDV